MTGPALPSHRILVTGSTGSGKTSLMRDWLMPPVPRALWLDQLGECWTWPGHIVTRSLDDALRQIAAGHRRVILTVKGRDLRTAEWERLAALLVPESPESPALGRLAPGLAICCSEADMLCPNGRTSDAWEEAYRRSRHFGVSLIVATQRAAAVDRIVSAQSNIIISCRQHEPRDLAYLAAVWPPDVARALATLPKFGALVYDQEHRTGQLLASPSPGRYTVTATWDGDRGWSAQGPHP